MVRELRLLSVGMMRNIHIEADDGALREFVSSSSPGSASNQSRENRAKAFVERSHKAMAVVGCPTACGRLELFATASSAVDSAPC